MSRHVDKEGRIEDRGNKGGEIIIENERSKRNLEDSSPVYRISLCVILIVSTILRFRGLGVESFWLDELTTLDAVNGGNWRDTMEGWLSMVGMGTWILYWWAQIVGTESDYALRSVSAITGILLIFLVSEFTRKHADEKAGIIAAGMMSVSYLSILYSQEFRPYMFTTLFIWISFYLIRKPEKLSKIQIAICITLLTLAYLIHYLAGLAIVLGLICDFVIRIKSTITNRDTKKQFEIRSEVRDYLNSSHGQRLMICFSLASVAIFMLEKMFLDSSSTNHSMWINDTPRRPVVSLFDYFVAFDDRGTITDIAESLWYFVLLSPLVLYLHRKMKIEREIESEIEWFVWAVGGGSMLMVVIYSIQFRPLWVSRYFVFSMPAWYILFGVSISKTIDLLGTIFNSQRINVDSAINGSWIIALVFTTIFASNSLHWLVNDFEYYEQGGRCDFRGMSEWLDENTPENQDDVFIVSQPYSRFWELYLDRMDSDVEIDTHGSWGDLGIGQLMPIIDDESDSVIHIRGHKKDMWNYDELTFVLNGSYELEQSYYFTEGQIDVYNRVRWLDS